jgi:hypothetical protein
MRRKIKNNKFELLTRDANMLFAHCNRKLGRHSHDQVRELASRAPKPINIEPLTIRTSRLPQPKSPSRRLSLDAKRTLVMSAHEKEKFTIVPNISN